MSLWVAAAGFVPDNGKAFAQRVGEVGKGSFHRKNLKRAEVWRKRPLS